MTAVATSSRVILRAATKAPGDVTRAFSSLRGAAAANKSQYAYVARAYRVATASWQAPSSNADTRRLVGQNASVRQLLASAAPSPILSRANRFYATTAYTEATPNASHLHSSGPSATGVSQEAKEKKDTRDSQAEQQPDPDEPPAKASIRERLRFLMRRYGWWALGVYMLASIVDFSLVFAAIHMLGADHIRDLEDQLRRKLGMGERKMDDHAVAAWPVPVSVPVEGTSAQVARGGVANNQLAVREALAKRGNVNEAAAGSTKAAESASQDASGSAEKPRQSSNSSSNSGTLWTEAVLAYTIHKTLLLPFRVGVTAAITPSFVKYLVRHGWARNNAAVHQATARANATKASRKAAAASAAGTTGTGKKSSS